ncbi:MAG: DEAD/DEAH box helicase [Opitutaceae bacterium]
MLRFHLPPNLAAAAARNAVPVRVEMNLAESPAAELLPALALLQRWCGPKPPGVLQLNRAQLRELVAATGGQPVFFKNGRPATWVDHDLLLDTENPAPITRRATPIAAPTFPPLTVDGSEHFLALTLPSREHPRYADALALVKEQGFTLEPSNRKWWLRDRHKTLNFLATQGTRLREELAAEFTANFQKNTAHLRPAEITAEVASLGADFSVTLGLRAGSADEAALRSAVAANRGYLEAEGKIFLLDAAQLQKLAGAQRALAGDPNAPVAPRRSQRVPATRAAETQEILEQLSPNFQAPETWRKNTSALRQLSTLAPAPIPVVLEAQLRPYQRLGVAWLWHLSQQNLGGILADEMGLGKTLQTLALLTAFPTPARGPRHLISDIAPASVGPSLVVAPASLLENWRRECVRFAPQLRVFVHHGDRRLASPDSFAAHDLVITSYGTLARDQELFAAVEFACVAADEAQHIKNRRSQNAAALRSLRAHCRFLLTGTPLENSLEDLRSLFEFLLPGYLTPLPAGIRGDERAWFDERLRAQTAPYLLRRTKQAVAPELPAKLEQVVWCELGPTQAALYRSTQEKSERELFDLEASGVSESKLKFAALTQLLRLRQICCDPRLVPGSQLSPLDSPLDFPDSAKLDAFRELVAEAVDDGHRLLVFSQFTSLLALLRAEFDTQQLAYCYLDGSMTAPARQVQIDRFQGNADVPIFLLSLKAGGTGLNLTGADTVIHFDPWWNPAAEAQATDRAHRIGQTRVVTSYKLIAAGTVEEKVLALQAEKRALLASVFEASDAASARLSLADLKSLLH